MNKYKILLIIWLLMIRLIRIILYPFRFLYLKYFPNKGFEPDKKPGAITHFVGKITGGFYYVYQSIKERLRIWKFKEDLTQREYIIDIQIVRHSIYLIAELFALSVFALFLDYGFGEIYLRLKETGLITDSLYLTLPTNNFVQSILEVIIGAISAILGIIFALYAVGFQMVTEKYSSEVSEFVNQEIVSNFFFKLLVFTDLFAIFVYVKSKIVLSPSHFSFITVLLLTFISLLGILIFKDHYITSIKPKRLFERIGGDISDFINIAAGIKRLTYNSWSIVYHARFRTRALIKLLHQLFDDLWEHGNFENANYALAVIGYLMNSYSKFKKFINTEKGWWFFNQNQLVKTEDRASLNLKLNYELQGRGPLYMQKPNLAWFEVDLHKLFIRIQDRIDGTPHGNSLLFRTLETYQTILVGQFFQNELGTYRTPKLAGAYENQEFSIFELFFDSFLKIHQRFDLKNIELFNEYLNVYFAVGGTIIEGFGDYEKIKLVIKKMVGNGRLRISKKDIFCNDLPTVFYKKIKDYWFKLQTEQLLEGKIITPVVSIEEEIITDLAQDESATLLKYFKLLLKHQDEIIIDLIKNNQSNQITQLLKVRFEWIARLIYLKKIDLAEDLADLILSELALGYILFTKKDSLIEFEILEQLEKIVFPAIIYYKPRLFQNSLRFLNLTLSVINQNEQDIEKLFIRSRLSLIIGAVAYLQSEFKEEWLLMNIFIFEVEKTFKPGYFFTAAKLLSEPKQVGGLDLELKLIDREISRYNHWFGAILSKINQLPKTYGEIEFYAGLQEVADHPSQFIREISYGLSNYEEDSIEALIGYLSQRQDKIKDIVIILTQIRNGKTSE